MKKKIAGFLVKYRKALLVLTVLAAVAGGALALGLKVNGDMTKYLPADHGMGQGMSIMNEEFPAIAEDSPLAAVFGAMTKDNASELATPPLLIGAVSIALLVLIIMSKSWLEPVLFIAEVGLAVLINLGTNRILPYVSEMTLTTGPLIQLALSMDYSIILMDRYRQEKAKGYEPGEAMKEALAGSFLSVLSSSLTTVAGLGALLFLSFGLGTELGIVLGKGVALSLLCVFTALPALILFFDKGVEKTAKKCPSFSAKGLAGFSLKARKIMPVVFVILLAGFYILQGGTTIRFTVGNEDTSSGNPVVILYDLADEGAIAALTEEAEKDPGVTAGVWSGNLLKKAMSGAELLPGFDMSQIDMSKGLQLMGEVTAQLKGERYGRVILMTDYAPESAETTAFIEKLEGLCGEKLEHDHWLIGMSPMAVEMDRGFPSEYRMIVLITAGAVFLVMLLAFRNFLVPLILTAMVQCAVFVTVAGAGIGGGSMYFMALLISQSILMGAAVDYGIVFSGHYREARKEAEIPAALRQAYEASLHTVMTSGSILVLVLGVLGIFSKAEVTSQVTRTMAAGALTAIVLILLILPGILVCVDRWVVKKETRRISAAGENADA